MSDAPLLELEDVHAFYGSAHILEGVSFSMGLEAIALIGRNGMGKSTLCNTIMGLCSETRGSIRVEGHELRGKPPYAVAKAGVGYVPQGRRLFQSLSVDEHLRMIRAPRKGRWNPSAVYKLFPRLAERKKISATQLSGGEQQMLALARAFLTRPRLLMLDEPSLGLAPIVTREVFRVVGELNRGEGVAVLVVEQNAAIALAAASRAYVLETGRTTIAGTATELRADDSIRAAYLGY